MSNAKVEIISSPSRNMTSSLSQTGNNNYEREAIKGELEADINNSAKCSFDAFLKYFLSVVLQEGSEQKKRLDELQTEIEKLQSQRYYGNLAGNGGSDVETAGADVNTEMGGQRGANIEDPDDDTRFGSEKEKELVKERDLILDDLLRDALDAVIPIANDANVKEKLEAFSTAFKEKEPSRYAPYVLLCNDVLKRLAPVGANLGVRKPDPLDIRFRRSDPKSIMSHFAEMKNDVDRRPDVIITSLAAALNADGLKEEDEVAKRIFSEKPKKKFEWQVVLSCDEFKVSKWGVGRIPEGGKSIHLNKPFKTENPRDAVSHANLASLDHDVAEVEALAPEGTEGSGSKRARESDYVEHSSPTKKQRQLGPESPSGSKLDSLQDSPVDRNSKMQANIIAKNTQEAINGRVQCASYALEMMSYSAGMHHAINLLFTDDYIWIWYYDRQGILQSDGLSIFWNFPRFLVLLLAFQRFTLEDWGVIPCLNPKALHGLREMPTPQAQPESTIRTSFLNEKLHQKRKKKKTAPETIVPETTVPETTVPEITVPEIIIPEIVLDLQQHLSGLWVPDDQNNTRRVEVNMNEFLSHQPHCLAGRATSVVAAKGYAEDGSSVPTPMVCKIYHPELQRRHEGLTLQVIRQIAMDNDKEMLKHLPTLLFYGDVPGCTTQRIRSMVKRKWKGHRTLRVICMKKLQKITSVQGTAFIKAWLETVICHAFLWKNYVEHGDPSLSNLMYDPDTQSGVLSDFDLSLLQWEPRVLGTERTGTVPFMAIEILTKDYWEGKIQRHYHHELESFIWILVYVSLLYDNGIRQPNSDVDIWRTANYIACCKNKLHFYTQNVISKAATRVKPSYQDYWPVVDELCYGLHLGHTKHDGLRRRPSDIDIPFLTSQDLWNTFNDALDFKLRMPLAEPINPLLPRLLAQKPSFRLPDEAMRELLHMKYGAILDLDQARSALGQ